MLSQRNQLDSDYIKKGEIVMEVKISRLEQYPTENPNSFAVGFTVSAANGRSFYQDILIPFSEAADDQSAVDFALLKMIDDFKIRCAELENISPLLGTVINSEEI